MIVDKAEKIFLSPKQNREKKSINQNAVFPRLSDFDEEISTYKQAYDKMKSFPDVIEVGWILLNFRPIKEVHSSNLIQIERFLFRRL